MSVFDIDNCRRCGAPVRHQEDYCDDYPMCEAPKPQPSTPESTKPSSVAQPEVKRATEANIRSLARLAEETREELGIALRRAVAAESELERVKQERDDIRRDNQINVDTFIKECPADVWEESFGTRHIAMRIMCARLSTMREALEKYTKHRHDCDLAYYDDIPGTVMLASTHKCTCGLSEALASLNGKGE